MKGGSLLKNYTTTQLCFIAMSALLLAIWHHTLDTTIPIFVSQLRI